MLTPKKLVVIVTLLSFYIYCFLHPTLTLPYIMLALLFKTLFHTHRFSYQKTGTFLPFCLVIGKTGENATSQFFKHI